MACPPYALPYTTGRVERDEGRRAIQHRDAFGSLAHSQGCIPELRGEDNGVGECWGSAEVAVSWGPQHLSGEPNAITVAIL